MSTQAEQLLHTGITEQNPLALTSDMRGEIHILRAWNGGPLRQFSENKRSPSWLSYDYKGDPRRRFAGQYVCDLCKNPVSGIYEPNYRVEVWSCRSCRKGLTTTDKAEPQ
jgi:hypothetical protein